MGAVAVETQSELAAFTEAAARGHGQDVWRRFKRDRVAVAGGVFIVSLVLAAFVGAPVAEHLLGTGPTISSGAGRTAAASLSAP